MIALALSLYATSFTAATSAVTREATFTLSNRACDQAGTVSSCLINDECVESSAPAQLARLCGGMLSVEQMGCTNRKMGFERSKKPNTPSDITWYKRGNNFGGMKPGSRLV